MLRPAFTFAHSTSRAGPVGVKVSMVFPKSFSLWKRKYDSLFEVKYRCVAGIANCNPGVPVGRNALVKAYCSASVPGESSLGVSGYVLSRCSAMAMESETLVFVDGSVMMGTV